MTKCENLKEKKFTKWMSLSDIKFRRRGVIKWKMVMFNFGPFFSTHRQSLVFWRYERNLRNYYTRCFLLVVWSWKKKIFSFHTQETSILKLRGVAILLNNNDEREREIMKALNYPSWELGKWGLKTVLKKKATEKCSYTMYFRGQKCSRKWTSSVTIEAET